METAYLFFWRRMLDTTFNYGAQVTYMADGTVQFEAPMMPPGKTIHAWTTTKDFEHNLQLAELPVLTPGETYALALNWEVKEDSVFCQIVFTDASGLEVGSEVLEDGKGTFTFPLTAYAYEIRLKNMRHEHVVFHYGMIIPVSVYNHFDIAVNLNHALVTFRARKQTDEPQVLGITERSSLTKPLWLPQAARTIFVVAANAKQLLDPQWCQETAAFLKAEFDPAFGSLTVAYQVGRHLGHLRQALRAAFSKKIEK